MWKRVGYPTTEPKKKLYHDCSMDIHKACYTLLVWHGKPNKLIRAFHLIFVQLGCQMLAYFKTFFTVELALNTQQNNVVFSSTPYSRRIATLYCTKL